MFTDVVGYHDAVRQDESLAKYLLDKQKSLVRQALSTFGGRDAGGNLAAGEETGLRGWIRGPGGKTQTKLQSSESAVIFGSALDAVRCAAEIQRMLREYNREAPSNKDIYVRIGIHFGEITEREGEVSGETMAVASRVAPLAEPGGVCVSEKVYRSVRDRSEFPFVRLERQALPVEVYRLTLPWEKQAPGEPVLFDPQRLAILPLANMSADPTDEYFADGMTEELISTTSSIKGLTIIARTSVMRYKGAAKAVEEIGRELRVGTVLEGSVRKAGNRLRITVQLIDVQSQGHLWAQSYDRDLEDVFAVQSDIAQRVAEALKVRLLENEITQVEKQATKNPEAYLFYLKGKHFWNKMSKDSMNKAIEFFERAIEQDRRLALAYVGIADCYNMLTDYAFLPSSIAYPKAEEAAKRALELDDELAEAHSAYAVTLTNPGWNWSSAESEHKRALALNPNYSTGHYWYSLYLRFTRRYQEALGEAKQALELDPLSPMVNAQVGDRFYVMKEYDLAIEYCQRALALEPNFYPAVYLLIQTYVEKAMYDEALDEQQKMESYLPKLPNNDFRYAWIYARAGRRKEASRILEDGLRKLGEEYVAPFEVSVVYLALGQNDKALEWLNKGYELRDASMPYYVGDPLFEGLRSDPLVTLILRKMGLE